MTAVPATEVAWAAGFFDGEGCTWLAIDRRWVRTSRVHMTVAQSERSTLERFQRAVGGKGYIKARTVRGARKQAYVWLARASEIEAVAELLWPYLSVPKREQYESVTARRAELREVA